MPNVTPLFVGLFLLPLVSHAASPYAGQQHRDLKALSAEEIAALEQGQGMGLARTAELNGWPGPKHVLELADELQLSDEQREKTRALFGRMEAKAKQLGAEKVEAERRLETLFRADAVDVDVMRALVAEIGRLDGALRATHLAAHVEQRAILSERQATRYVELRGYGAHANPSHAHAHH